VAAGVAKVSPFSGSPRASTAYSRRQRGLLRLFRTLLLCRLGEAQRRPNGVEGEQKHRRRVGDVQRLVDRAE